MGYQVDEVYPSNSDHLKSEDIGNAMPEYTIARVEMKEFDNNDGKERKLVLVFQEVDKTLVLNATNSRAIKEMYGGDTDMWLGKRVMLFTMAVQFGDKMTTGLRVRAPASPQQNTGGPAHNDPTPPPATEYPEV